MIKKHRKKYRAVWLVLLLSLCVMAISGFKLSETMQVYQIGEESYAELADMVRPAGIPVFYAAQEKPAGASKEPAKQESPALAERETGTGAKIELPEMDIDFGALQEVNPSGQAWLYCPGTAIDYPVMRAIDYDYYLHHLPNGARNANGSLFIDYNNAPDFSDGLTVIYGHNMKSGQMFGSLTEYKKQAYFAKHPYMYLYTPGGNCRIDLMYGCVIGAGEWRERAFMYEVNLNSLLAYAAQNTTFSSETRYAEGDRVVALSTCSYEFNDARYVVIGVLRPE